MSLFGGFKHWGPAHFGDIRMISIPLQEGDTVESQWTRRRFHKERFGRRAKENGLGLHSHVGCSPKKETGGFKHRLSGHER